MLNFRDLSEWLNKHSLPLPADQQPATAILLSSLFLYLLRSRPQCSSQAHWLDALLITGGQCMVITHLPKLCK